MLSFESYSIAIAYYLKEDLLPLENFYRTAIIGLLIAFCPLSYEETEEGYCAMKYF